MLKFNEKFLMNSEEVIDYVLEKTDLFNSRNNLKCVEFGDGNVNYIFKIWDEKTGKSFILKQAGDTARASKEFKFSPDRNRTEAKLLKLQGKLAKGTTPEIYHVDTIMNCFIMEDLSDYTILRNSLLEHKRIEGLSEVISTYLVNALIMTTDIVMNHKEKRILNEDYVNPVLCDITKDVVYTEPFTNYLNRNSIFPPMETWIEKEYYKDEKLKLEVAKVKYEFMNNAQALIHGDLHTGSIFVKDNSIKVIDPEFAFYGPIGHDVGNLIAHLIFAWANADASIEDLEKKQDYKKYLEDMIIDIIDLFKEKFKSSFMENNNDPSAKVEGFIDWYLDGILKNISGVAGIEISRRLLGIVEAKIADIETITDEKLRIRAEKISLSMAKNLIKDRENFDSGINYINELKRVEKLYEIVGDEKMIGFKDALSDNSLNLKRKKISTLQINMGKKCNQVCVHCHVNGGPDREEIMGKETIDRILELISKDETIETVDITGGAPELNSNFRYLIDELYKLEKTILNRCNLTVLFEKGQEDTAKFLADRKVQIMASLPCYLEENVNEQRGDNVFGKSIGSINILNDLGYGKEGTGLILNLVFNPKGASLPPPQMALEEDYKKHLKEDYNIDFNNLLTITNMPINRFGESLKKQDKYDKYYEVLVDNFNPDSALNVMCRDLLSISWDGKIYDCDFNQALEMPLTTKELSIWDIESFSDVEREISFDNHCFACTAGSGSSCTGALV